MSYGVLGGVGRTPLVELKQVKLASGTRIAVKLEAANPTGSDEGQDGTCPSRRGASPADSHSG